jgi:hypothetical protein
MSSRAIITDHPTAKLLQRRYVEQFYGEAPPAAEPLDDINESWDGLSIMYFVPRYYIDETGSNTYSSHDTGDYRSYW